jgi:integrase
VPTNVAIKAVAPAQQRSTARVRTADEVAKLLRAAEDFCKSMAPAIAIAALTGARAGEIAGLRWSDIDLDCGTVTIDKAATEVGGRVTIKSTKTDEDHIARGGGRNLMLLQSVLS